MSDENLWIKAIAAVICVFILTAGGCTIHKNELRCQAIKAGVDPMVLSCAAGVNSNEQHICTLLAQREGKK